MSVKRKGRIRASQKRRNQNRGAVVAVAVVAMAVLLMSMLSGSLFAKYISSQTDNERTEAAAFYFNSNLLTESGASYIYPENTGSITFTAYNYADALRCSECDITYEVILTGTDASGSTVNQTLQNAAITGGSASGSTASFKKGQQSIHTITFSGLSAGEYTITANATSPYTDKLSATFYLPAASNEIKINMVDQGAYVDVTVAVMQGGNVTLTWPDGVIPDTTDSIFDNVTMSYADQNNSYAGGSATITFENNASHTFSFLKQYNTGTITGDFTAAYQATGG